MPLVNADEPTLKTAIESEGIVLIDFWAEWCGPCKMFGPIYEKVAGNHDDITFAKVDTEAEQEIAGAFGIRSIPTVMLFRDGVLLFRHEGAIPEEALEDIITQGREVDMEEVQKQIEEHEAAHARGECDHDH